MSGQVVTRTECGSRGPSDGVFVFASFSSRSVMVVRAFVTLRRRVAARLKRAQTMGCCERRPRGHSWHAERSL